jgi:hypothetical protein|nr:MAG TPA: hypothetical protein [Caudoviricetes sp.]
MLTARQVFDYTRLTARDLFDDVNELDFQLAKRDAGEKNTAMTLLSKILTGLDLAGVDVDDVEIRDLLEPTADIDVLNKKTENTDISLLFGTDDEDEEDELVESTGPQGFVESEETGLRDRLIKKNNEQTVIKSLEVFLLSDINHEMLMDAPYDVAMALFNRAAKTREKELKKNKN